MPAHMSGIRIRSISVVPESDRDFKLTLVAGEGEQDLREAGYQAELHTIGECLREQGLNVAVGSGFQKAAGMSSWLTGEFIVHAAATAALVSAAAKPMVPALVEWIRGRAGRKVRLKKGDVEIEARTVEEVERLWKTAEGDDEQP